MDNNPLPTTEEALLHAINTFLPEQIWQEYCPLVVKCHEYNLTQEEHSRLIELGNEIEIRNAHRIHNLIRLAQLRQTSLDVLMKQLDIKPRPIPGLE